MSFLIENAAACWRLEANSKSSETEQKQLGADDKNSELKDVKTLRGAERERDVILGGFLLRATFSEAGKNMCHTVETEALIKITLNPQM